MTTLRPSSATLLLVAAVMGCGDSALGPNGSGPPVASIVLSADSLLIPSVGLRRNLTATPYDSDGRPMAGVSVVWGSRDPRIVQVAPDGAALSRNYGEALVIASAGEAADTALVRVLQIPEVMSMEAPDTLDALGLRVGLLLAMTDSGGAPILGERAVFTSSNPSVARVGEGGGSGFVEAIGPGTASVTATFRGVSEAVEVVVAQATESVWLTGGQSTLSPGDTTTFGADVYDPRGDLIIDAEVVWSTSDPTVASVSSSGLVTAIGSGNVLIYASRDGLTGWGGIAVIPGTPPSGTLRLTPQPVQSDGWGEEIVLDSFMDDGSGALVPVPAVWTSRDPGVASIAQSVARTQGNGTTWLIAEYDGQIDSVTVVVSRVSVALIFQGVTSPLTLNLSDPPPTYPATLDRFGTLQAVQPIWTVRDSSLVRVSQNDLVGLREGSTWVIAAAQGVRDSVLVNVIPEYWGNFTIETPEDLVRFEQIGVADMIGTLRIYGTTLTAVPGLESLRSIRGSVWVKFNDDLDDLTGLQNLESVSGRIIIEKNPKLLATLPRLVTVGALDVFDNLGFHPTDQFSSLEVVAGRLYLGDRGITARFQSLRSVGSLMVAFGGPGSLVFPSLEFVDGDMAVIDVPEVRTVSAPRLWSLRSLTIRGNSLLTELDFAGLTALGRDLTIETNPVLPNLDGFAALTSSIRELFIDSNASLANIGGLRQLGDALGSDPILLGPSRIERNPLLPAAHVEEVKKFLEDKFPGGAFNALRVSGNGQ